MKKRFLALFLTLVMLMPVLPAAVSADTEVSIPELEETELNFTQFTKTGSGFSADAGATLEGKFVDAAPTDFRALELLEVFNQVEDKYITQEICIEQMPVFKKIVKPNSHVSGGFFMSCVRGYSANAMYYINVSIYRTDDAGNLSVVVATKSDDGNFHLDQVYPLNKKVGDTFKLMTAWYADGSVDLFCDGELIHSFDETSTFSHTSNSSRKNYLRIGYSAFGAEATAATSMDVKVIVDKVTIGRIPDHVHTPAADDGDCTTAVMCTSCGEVAVVAMPSHKAAIANFKYATETEKGYTGDQVCYVCNHELAKGEETPLLVKTGTKIGNQGVDNGPIFVYILIGAVVLAVAVVIIVVVLVKRKKQNQK